MPGVSFPLIFPQLAPLGGLELSTRLALGDFPAPLKLEGLLLPVTTPPPVEVPESRIILMI